MWNSPIKYDTICIYINLENKKDGILVKKSMSLAISGLLFMFNISLCSVYAENHETTAQFNHNNSLKSKNNGDEIRAVWIATVNNLNWPKSLEKDEQKKEMVENLDLIKSLGFNKVYFQVRCRSDAMYESKMFPWSKWLTGELDKNPKWDPLKFMIEECKKRNISLEAWINPFFVGTKSGGFNIQEYINVLPKTNPLKQHPNWIATSEDGWYMLNPGIPEVRNLVIEEATYIAKKYKVNIHMDDYFYPYPENKESVVVFHDENEFLQYGGSLTLDNWRRNNIDVFVKELCFKIKSIDNSLTFSISPFAIWKNSVEDGGCGTNGLESYYKIYSDSVKWVKEGWIDYIIPQIYWNIGFKPADYESLANWWNNTVESTNVKLIIGLPAYRLDPNAPNEAFRSSKSIEDQINLNHTLKNVSGFSIFSLNALKDNVLDINKIF